MGGIKAPVYDKRFYDTIWGEAAGGSPAEIKATAAIYDNLVQSLGYEQALAKSNAYRKKSPQYQKAATGNMNAFEKSKYALNQMLINQYLNDPNKLPYIAHENVKEYGDPSWAPDYLNYDDVGRQRFYYNPRSKAIKGK